MLQNHLTATLTSTQKESLRKILETPEVKDIKMAVKRLSEDVTVSTQNKSQKIASITANLSEIMKMAKAVAKKFADTSIGFALLYKALVTDIMLLYVAFAIARNEENVKSGKMSREQIINRAVGRDGVSFGDTVVMTGITALGGSGKDPFSFIPPYGFVGEPICFTAGYNYYHATRIMDKLPGIRRFLPEGNLKTDNYLQPIFNNPTPKGNLTYEELKTLPQKDIQDRMEDLDLFKFVQAVKCREYFFDKGVDKKTLSSVLKVVAYTSENPLDYRILLKNGASKDEFISLATQPDSKASGEPKENFVRFAKELERSMNRTPIALSRTKSQDSISFGM